jgi:DNA-binding SARP family transcriptional activator
VPVTEGGSSAVREDEPVLRVCVLGEVRATRDGAVLDLGPPKARAVLTALAMAEGRSLDLDALTELVWPDGQVPRDPIGGLHVYISGLRRILEPPRGPRARPQVLVTSGGGYALDRSRVSVDAVEVAQVAAGARRLLREAHSQIVPVLDVPADVVRTTLEQLEAALARWHGQPYRESSARSG